MQAGWKLPLALKLWITRTGRNTSCKRLSAYKSYDRIAVDAEIKVTGLRETDMILLRLRCKSQVCRCLVLTGMDISERSGILKHEPVAAGEWKCGYYSEVDRTYGRVQMKRKVILANYVHGIVGLSETGMRSAACKWDRIGCWKEIDAPYCE